MNQENKLLSESILEIKNQIDSEVNNKLSAKEKIITNLKSIINEIRKECRLLSEENRKLTKKIDSLIRDKNDCDEILTKQEEKLKSLERNFKEIEELLRRKNVELNKNEDQSKALIKIIEEQKYELLGLKEKGYLSNIKNKETSEYCI